MTATQAHKDHDAEARLARFAGLGMLALGALGVLGAILGFAFSAPIPPPLHHSNLAIAVLELGLGAGVASRARGPWSFAIAAEGVITLVNVLGLPELLRAEDWFSLGMAATRGVLFTLLILCAGAISSREPDLR